MPKRRLSFYIHSEGASADSVRQALEWLISYPNKERGYIAVMSTKNLDGVISGVLEDLHPSIVKTLKTKGSVRLGGKDISLVTMRKPIQSGNGLPMVVFFPSRDFLDQIDDIPDIEAVLVVPWNMKEIELWIRTWNATELGKQEKQAEPLIRNKVVEQALRYLTTRVNVSTGITHPLDSSLAIQIFETLRDAGEEFAPDEVKAWLIAEGGWKASDAQKVADLAKQVLNRKRLRKGPYNLEKDILRKWRESASAETKTEENNE